ncbi:MAG: serine/threonine protein kinase, partial [Myxococcales bacterium]|nr:serine/threonine protein kinase [Myxococcales bacterium]
MNSEPRAKAELYCSSCERTYDEGEACPRDGTRLIRLVTHADPFVGRDLDGRYAIVERIGQGGMGAVYRGVQRSVDRQVAIKVVTPSMMSEPAIIKRFLREARLASRLDHPNVVQIFDFGQTPDGVFYLVMELVPGKTLEAILDEEVALDPARTIEIAVQICAALEAAHAVPMVHRDLKPANVLIDARGLVKVLDFGIAKSLAPDTLSATMTRAGAVIGTPAYMPPELAQGRELTTAADLYSLGCMLFYALTGRLPFDADALPEIVRMHVHEPVPPLPPTVPRALAHVVRKLMEKDPARRYPSAAAARVALENALVAPAGRPAMQTTLDLGSAPGGAVRSRPRSASSRRWWPLAALGVIAIGGGVAAAIALSGGHAAPAAPPDAHAEVAESPSPIVEPIVIDAAVPAADPVAIDVGAGAPPAKTPA